MMEWVEKSDRRSRFFSTDAMYPLDDTGLDRTLGAIAYCLATHIAGKGNAVEFDTAFLEVRCDSGRLIAALGSEKARKSSTIDGCAVRWQALQDFSYDLFDADTPDTVYTEKVREMVRTIGERFGPVLTDAGLVEVTALKLLHLVVYGADADDVVHNETLRGTA